LSEFNATVLLVQDHIRFEKDGDNVTKSLDRCTTNQKNLEVIRLFDNGNCRVSSIRESRLLSRSKDNGSKPVFKVDFNTGDNLDVQQIIVRFDAVFVFKGISEVDTK